MNGRPTATNLFVLRREFARSHRIANRIASTSAEHMRRCLRAGLVTVDGKDLVLTIAGLDIVSGGAS